MAKINTDLLDALHTLEAERLVETVKLRNDLIKVARELLPEAIRQAKPKRKSKKNPNPKPTNPALLRLISRLAMRPLEVERRKK